MAAKSESPAGPRAEAEDQKSGVAYLDWDKTELRHIAEIARRMPPEGVAAVAKDFSDSGFWCAERGKL